MRVFINILLISLFFLTGCTDDSDGTSYSFGYPDPGSSDDQGQYVQDQFSFEWMTGNHALTGYPFISGNDVVSNGDYHIGFTMILMPADTASGNVITEFHTHWQLFKKKDGVTQEITYVFGEMLDVNNDTISLIYDGYYISDSLWDYQVKYTFRFEYKEPLGYVTYMPVTRLIKELDITLE